jgi:prepilin-type N-terminal cleavage/methylation domain-containing protein
MGKKTKINGFTLLEILMVITLTSILMVTVFQALNRVKRNEAKFDRQRDEEKEVYLLFNRLSSLFKNISSCEIFNNREFTVYFRGVGRGMVFLSRAPLISPYGGIHFIELRFEKKKLLYREKTFGGRGEADFVSFDELEGEAVYTLLGNVENLQFRYYVWDKDAGNFSWKREANSFEKDPLPLDVSLRMFYEGKDYDLLFPRVITDKNEEIPDDLFK